MRHKIIRSLVIGYMIMFALSIVIAASSFASLLLYKIIKLLN